MKIENCKIEIGIDTRISSEWAIPDGYQPGQDDAVILAHGAGNDMQHPFLSQIHLGLAEGGLLSVKFNFPYTELGRKAPDRAPILEQTWRAVTEAVRSDATLAPKRLFLGGKSMGGRIASQVVAQGVATDGLIFLGYPLHPAGQPGKLRVGHWPDIHCRVLFIQGTRDALCQIDALKTERVHLAGSVTLHEIPGGDHSFKRPKAAGQSAEAVIAEIVACILAWVGRA